MGVTTFNYLNCVCQTFIKMIINCVFREGYFNKVNKSGVATRQCENMYYAFRSLPLKFFYSVATHIEFFISSKM